MQKPAPLLIKDEKVLEINIEKGAPDAEKYFFYGEADEYPNRLPGDVVFVI